MDRNVALKSVKELAFKNCSLGAWGQVGICTPGMLVSGPFLLTISLLSWVLVSVASSNKTTLSTRELVGIGA